jgi:hypothetical protein
MAYAFQAYGWEDFEGDRHRGEPTDISETHGVLVSVTNLDDPEDTRMFWAYDYGTFESWAEWWVYIEALMDGYGLSLA